MKLDIKITLALLVLWSVIAVSFWSISTRSYEEDLRKAEAHCAQLDAFAVYTYKTHYICVTIDGRVVGQEGEGR